MNTEERVQSANVEKTVHEVVRQIVEQKRLTTPEIKNDQRLIADLGFESLDLAQLVAMLEIRLNFDPFSNDVAITSMRTVGDIVDAYQFTLKKTAAT
ncbi:MAG TPA: phosphopantetheine-binding protein [Blastocatellia bacterium]|nr:phosphopantetheine-binding protein [Blastocatellia bacterium]